MPNYFYKMELEGNDGFILDTDLLDTGLLGYLVEDVTSYVRSVSVRRGKSTNLDEFTAGQMTAVFDNRSRAFDPNYTSSPYYGAILPRRKLIFSLSDNQVDWVPQFTGFVDDWSFSYDVSGESTTTASCSDAFTLLANQNVTLTTPAAELASDRIQRVLLNSSVAWPNVYAGIASVFTMDSVTYSGNALEYIQKVAGSERGYFFINQSGNAVFYGWNYFALAITVLTFADYTGYGVYPFTNIETEYSSDQLYNFVTVTGSAGTVTAQDTTSQNDFGIAAGTFDVVTAGTAQMQTLANYVISNYKNPRFRVSEFTVSLDDVNTDTFLVSTIDIGEYVQVDYKPNQIGTVVGFPGYIIGKSINASPERCDVSFSLASNESRSLA